MLDFAELDFIESVFPEAVDDVAGFEAVDGDIGFGTVVVWANAAVAVNKVSAALSKIFFIFVPVRVHEYTCMTT